MEHRRALRSDIAWSDAERIAVHGYDLAGHVLEQARQPMALELWHRVEDEAAAHIRGRFREKD